MGQKAVPAPEGLSERSQLLWAQGVPKLAATLHRQTAVEQALRALDRAEKARQAVDAEGMVLPAKVQGKMRHAHPAKDRGRKQGGIRATVEEPRSLRRCRPARLLGRMSTRPIASGCGVKATGSTPGTTCRAVHGRRRRGTRPTSPPPSAGPRRSASSRSAAGRSPCGGLHRRVREHPRGPEMPRSLLRPLGEPLRRHRGAL